MKIKNLFILDYTRIQFLIKIILILTVLFFCLRFINEEFNFITFINITFLLSVNLFLFYMFLSFKKELSYIQIYPLVIFYFFLTYSLYFYLSVDMQQKILPNDYWRNRIMPSMNLPATLVYLGLIF